MTFMVEIENTSRLHEIREYSLPLITVLDIVETDLRHHPELRIGRIWCSELRRLVWDAGVW